MYPDSDVSANCNRVKFAAAALAITMLTGCAAAVPPLLAQPSDQDSAPAQLTKKESRELRKERVDEPRGPKIKNAKAQTRPAKNIADHRGMISSRLNLADGDKIATALATAKADAQKIDVSTMTCRQFVGNDEGSRQVILAWFFGFYSEVENPQVIDLGKLDNFRQKLLSLCKEEPEFRMTTAAEGVFAK